MNHLQHERITQNNENPRPRQVSEGNMSVHSYNLEDMANGRGLEVRRTKGQSYTMHGTV